MSKNQDRQKLYARQREYRARLKAEGKCVRCGTQCFPAYQCTRCRNKIAKRKGEKEQVQFVRLDEINPEFLDVLMARAGSSLVYDDPLEILIAIETATEILNNG